MWVAAAAKAAVEVLLGQPFTIKQSLLVPSSREHVIVPVSSSSLLAGRKKALAISHCQSGLALDLTRGLEVWTLVEFKKKVLDSSEALVLDDSEDWLQLIAGFGVGTHSSSGQFCLSQFARELLHHNLRPLVPVDSALQLEVIFPRGEELATRTSNHAFDVVNGLALIGTQAEAKVSASPDQLQIALDLLRSKSQDSSFSGDLTMVIGENGMDIAKKLGISSNILLKVGNWVGPLLVAAAEVGVKQLLLIGYHGKLVKLAGGIFHTHHHLADARLEILTAIAVKEGLPLNLIQSISQADSLQRAYLILEDIDQCLAHKLWCKVAISVEERSVSYLHRYGSWNIDIGAALFDRTRRLRWIGSSARKQLDGFNVTLED